MITARILAACRRRGIDCLVAVAALFGILVGPTCTTLVVELAQHLTTCTDVRAVHQQQHVKEESA